MFRTIRSGNSNLRRRTPFYESHADNIYYAWLLEFNKYALPNFNIKGKKHNGVDIECL